MEQKKDSKFRAHSRLMAYLQKKVTEKEEIYKNILYTPTKDCVRKRKFLSFLLLGILPQVISFLFKKKNVHESRPFVSIKPFYSEKFRDGRKKRNSGTVVRGGIQGL